MMFQAVAPKAGTPGVAVDPAAGATSAAPAASPPGGALTMFLPLLIMVPFLFLMFRRQKKEQEGRSKLKKGDKVVTQSGLVGELIEMDEKLAKVKIAPGVNVQVLASSLGPLDPKPAKADDKDLADLKEAKATADKK
jgi:preprotein translocase subunit YajC